MANTNDHPPFKQSIARQVAAYTDLDITKTTGEYYITATYANAFENTWVAPNGTLQVEIDNYLNETLKDIYQKVMSLGVSDTNAFKSNTLISAAALDGGAVLTSSIVGDQGVKVWGATVEVAGTKYAAFPGDWHKLQNYGDPNSIFNASATTPVFVLNQNKLYIFPLSGAYTYEVEYSAAPSAGILHVKESETAGDIMDIDGDYAATGGFMLKADYPSAMCQLFFSSLYDTDQLADGTQYMPELYTQGLVYGVSSKLLMKRMMDMQKKLPTLDDYSGDIVDETADLEGWQKVRYYVESEEDSELTQIKIAELNGQQQEWVLKYQWYQQQKQLVDNLYMGIFNPERRGN